MLLDYINAAMSRAKIETLDDGSWYAEIPGFRGVWADATTRTACRRQLQEVLEDWIVLILRLGHNPPRLRGVRPFPRLRNAG